MPRTDEETRNTLDRVRKLVAQAVDPTTTEDEARTFAHLAVRAIAEEKLALVPADVADDLRSAVEGANRAFGREIERVRREANSSSTQKLVLGVLGGLALGKYVKL